MAGAAVFRRSSKKISIPILDSLETFMLERKKASVLHKTLATVSKLSSPYQPSMSYLKVTDPASYLHKLLFSSSVIDIKGIVSTLTDKDKIRFFVLLANSHPTINRDNYRNIGLVIDSILKTVKYIEDLEEILSIDSRIGEILMDYIHKTQRTIDFNYLARDELLKKEAEVLKIPVSPRQVFKIVPIEYHEDAYLNDLIYSTMYEYDLELERIGPYIKAIIEYSIPYTLRWFKGNVISYIDTYGALDLIKFCIKKNKPEMIKILFDIGVDPSLEEDSSSPLLEAVKADNLEIAKIILYWPGFHMVEDIDVFSEIKSKEMKQLLLYWAEFG